MAIGDVIVVKGRHRLRIEKVFLGDQNRHHLGVEVLEVVSTMAEGITREGLLTKRNGI